MWYKGKEYEAVEGLNLERPCSVCAFYVNGPCEFFGHEDEDKCINDNIYWVEKKGDEVKKGEKIMTEKERDVKIEELKAKIEELENMSFIPEWGTDKWCGSFIGIELLVDDWGYPIRCVLLTQGPKRGALVSKINTWTDDKNVRAIYESHGKKYDNKYMINVVVFDTASKLYEWVAEGLREEENWK